MIEAPFLGLRPAAFRWMDGIAANNSKGWFDENRATFEDEVKGPLTRLLDELGAELGGQAKVFRQNRDVRFSKDKSPYKTNTYGVVTGIGAGGFGLYVSIGAAGVTAGTGEYDLAKDQLERMRWAIMDPESGPALDAALAAVRKAGVEVSGEALKTAPRSFPKDHPRIDLLRLKQVLMMKLLPREAAEGRAAVGHTLGVWRATEPVRAWLSAHVGPSTTPPEARFARR